MVKFGISAVESSGLGPTMPSFYLTTLTVTQIQQRFPDNTDSNEWTIVKMNWKGYGRKRLWSCYLSGLENRVSPF
jgi:hypothetical protein